MGSCFCRGMRRTSGLVVLTMLACAVWASGCSEREAAAPTAAPAQAPAADVAAEEPASDTDDEAEDTSPDEGGGDGYTGISSAEAKKLATVDEALAAFEEADQALGGIVAGGAVTLAAGDDRCARACKAFASMRRAADRVCELSSETDARCVRVRKRVKVNEERVAACGDCE